MIEGWGVQGEIVDGRDCKMKRKQEKERKREENGPCRCSLMTYNGHI